MDLPPDTTPALTLELGFFNLSFKPFVGVDLFAGKRAGVSLEQPAR